MQLGTCIEIDGGFFMNNIIYKDSNNAISIEFLYEYGGYSTYTINVSTNGFSGKCSFCLESNTIKSGIETIKIMIDSLNGEYVLRDCESDAYIRFIFESSMNLFAEGQLGGSYNDNMLKFRFKADQTLLQGLIHSLLDKDI